MREPDPDTAPTGSVPNPTRGINLAGASVTLRIKSRDGLYTNDCPCVPDADQTVENAGARTGRGWVTIDPTDAPGFTSRQGWYRGEFVVTWAGGAVQRVPNEGWIDVEIEESLA